MKLNLQLFGGRGQNSKGKRASNKKQTTEEKWLIPDNITEKQKRRLEYIRSSAVGATHGEKYKDGYELKRFDVSVSEYGGASVIVTTGAKGNNFVNETAIIFIGKNGGMRHILNNGSRLKPTKYLSQAFYDYEYGKGRKRK